jgi:hypothetical protein
MVDIDTIVVYKAGLDARGKALMTAPAYTVGPGRPPLHSRFQK